MIILCRRQATLFFHYRERENRMIVLPFKTLTKPAIEGSRLAAYISHVGLLRQDNHLILILDLML